MELLKAQNGFSFSCVFSKFINKKKYFPVIMKFLYIIARFCFEMKIFSSFITQSTRKIKIASLAATEAAKISYWVVSSCLHIRKLHFLQFITSNETINIINSRRVFHLPRHDINVQMCFIEMPGNFFLFFTSTYIFFGRGWYFLSWFYWQSGCSLREERKRLEMLVKWIALSFIK